MKKYENVAIICNTMNEQLFKASSNLYKHLKNEYNIDIIKFLGSSGIYSFNFMNHIITSQNKFNYDYMIFIDEDMFVTNINNLLSLLDYMIKNNYDLCGMPDGGVISHRTHNPIAINTFLCILNMKNIRRYYNNDIVINEIYKTDLLKFQNNDLTNKFNVEYDNFEPYYKIMFHILRNKGNILYLNANDAKCDFTNITTELLNQNNDIIGYHTWYAREYGKFDTHTLRINNVCQSLGIKAPYNF